MVNPSPDVIGRNFNNLMDVEGGGNLTRKVNIINSIDSTDNHKSNDFVNVGTGDPLRVFHQNIRGLQGKVNELINSVTLELPHILCITEHHLKDSEIDLLPITHYKLGAKYCRQIFKKWWREYLCSYLRKIYQY